MKTLIRALVAAFVLLSQLPLSAQSISWQQLNGPDGGGGFVYAGKNGFIFTILDDVRLYRSSNNGQSWQKVPQPPAYASYRPNSVGYDGNLYTDDFSEIYRSSDDGQTWAKLDFGIGSISAVTGLPDNVILIGDNEGKIHRSTDEGQTWAANKVANEELNRFSYNPASSHVYAWSKYPSNAGRIYRSTDKGLSWTLFFDKAGAEIYSMAFSPNGSVLVGVEAAIWRTTDNGANWAIRLFPPPGGSNGVQVTVTSIGRVFAQSWYSSFYSDDNCSTWKNHTDPEGNTMASFSALPDGTLFASRLYSPTLRRSIDNGNTWVFSANGIRHPVMTDMAFIDKEQALATTLDGLFYSPKNGENWHLIYDKMSSQYYPKPLTEVSPNGDWYVYNGRDLIRFTDKGQKYQVVNYPLGTFNEPEDFFIHPQTGTLFLLDWTSYRSTDGGITWQDIDQHASNYTFMPDGSIVATTMTGVEKSTDDGQTWSRLSAFRPDFMTLSPSGILYNLRPHSPPSIWTSLDNGLTWDSAWANLPSWVSAMTVNAAEHLFAVSSFGTDKLLRSVDGGYTFQSMLLNIGDTHNPKIHLAPDQHLYLLTDGDGLYRSTAPTTNITVMKGEVFADLDKTCSFSAPDTITQGWPVKATRGSETVYGFAGISGKYVLPVGTGNYEVSVVPPNDYWKTCKTTASAVAGGGTVEGVDVGVQALIECPYMEVDVAAPFLRRCFEGQITISYCNKGTAAAVGAYVEITLDSLLIFNGSTLPVASQSGHTYRFDLGDVAVGECGSFRIRCTPSCEAALGEIHCIEAHIYPDEICPPLPRPQVRTSAVCAGDSIRLTVQNVGTAAMSVPRSWRAIDPDNYEPPFGALASGTFQLGVGQSLTRSVAAQPRLQLVAEQDPAYPYNVVSQTEVRNCGSSSGSAPLSIVSDDEEGPFADVLCLPNQGSFDPNDKTGYPLGIADKHYIAREQDLEYLIRFQNTGTDTAFNITVRDTLPLALLDPASVRPGASSHPYTFSISPRGVLLFTFQNILLPDSNINEAASHGFVQFRVAQQGNTANGSSIRNRAAIYFDFNEPVITNTTLHTVGIPALVSVRPVAAVPETALDVSPNPMAQQTTLTLRGEVPGGDLLLECYDSANRLLRSQTFRGGSVVVERGDWPAGVYSMVVKTATGAVLGSGQVVVR